MTPSNFIRYALGFVSCSAAVGCAQDNKIDVSSSRTVSIFNAADVDKTEIKDSLYIDTTKCVKETNECDIVIRLCGKTIYSVKSSDGNIEIDYNSSLIKRNKHYVFMNVNDLAVGVTWNIVVIKETGEVFVTDKYDVHAVGDSIIPYTISKNNRSIMVRSAVDSSKTYFVKLNLFNKI